MKVKITMVKGSKKIVKTIDSTEDKWEIIGKLDEEGYTLLSIEEE